MSSELPSNEQPQPSTEPQASTSSWPLLGGITLILLGGYFLAQQFGWLDALPLPNFNCWALFILLPAFAIGQSAWRTYQANGEQFNREVRSKAMGAGMMLMVALVFLFGISWGVV